MRKEKEILSNIEACLKDRGISKLDFAKEIGCSTRLVHYWFRGERGISIDMVDKALKFLGVSFILGNSNMDKERMNTKA